MMGFWISDSVACGAPSGRGWVRGQHQAVAVGPGPRAALGRERGLPDALQQLRRGRVQAHAAGQRAPGPGVLQHAEVACEDGAALGALHAKGLEGFGRAARAQAHLQAAAGQQVQHGRVLGHAQRVFQRQRDHARADADAPRARRHMGQKDEGRGQAALAFMEMVLGHPGRVEAVGLGMGDLLGHQAVALAGRRIVEQAAEEAQARAAAGAVATVGIRRGEGQNQCSFCREWRP